MLSEIVAASPGVREGEAASLPCIFDLSTMKPYDFGKVCAIGNLWFVLTDGVFPSLRKDSILDPAHIAQMHQTLEHRRDELNYVGLSETAKYVSNIRQRLNEGKCKTYADYCRQVEVLHDLALNEIEGRIFGFIPKENARYFQQDALFGTEVNNKFSSAKDDIKEAGNCYAHGTYTACVFHLMRVLEIALHKLANDLGVTFPTAIELENWKNIIDKIESAIKALEQLPKSQQKSEDIQYYSEAAKEFRYFKDAWRNHVSHSRVDYEVHDATKIMEHVRDFMKQLAKR